jgi:hypothetical protein
MRARRERRRAAAGTQHCMETTPYKLFRARLPQNLSLPLSLGVPPSLAHKYVPLSPQLAALSHCHLQKALAFSLSGGTSRGSSGQEAVTEASKVDCARTLAVQLPAARHVVATMRNRGHTVPRCGTLERKHTAVSAYCVPTCQQSQCSCSSPVENQPPSRHIVLHPHTSTHIHLTKYMEKPMATRLVLIRFAGRCRLQRSQTSRL